MLTEGCFSQTRETDLLVRGANARSPGTEPRDHFSQPDLGGTGLYLYPVKKVARYSVKDTGSKSERLEVESHF